MSRISNGSPPRFSRALLPYLGGKRRLCPLIFGELAAVVPPQDWPGRIFLDPFAGGGAVALMAKAYGFHVVASDVAVRSVVTGRALLENSTVRLGERDVLDLYQTPTVSYPHVAASLSPQVFSPFQAAWLDGAKARADRRPDPVRSLLHLVIMKAALRLQPGSVLNATDAMPAHSGDFDRVSPRRLGLYLRADALLQPNTVWRLATAVNAGVFGGHGEVSARDAVEAIRATPRADVVYLDPPYAQTIGYVSPYAALDTFLGDTGSSAPVPSLDALLTAAADIPHVVLSYGGPSMSLPQLVALVERHRRVLRALEIPYLHMRPLARKDHRDADREFLIIAAR